MNERQKALLSLSAQQFALLELHMYLDTHPGDEQALAKYNEHYEKYEKLLAEFEEKYGPVLPPATGADWLKDPWPWENAEESD